MIKTLRITTFIAAILAVGVLAFPVVYGDWGDEEIEKFLKSPGAIERFKKAKGAKVKTGSQVSPLVTQAVLYAGIINPRLTAQVPPKPRLPRKVSEVVPIQKPLGPVSVKFDLIGTSYYASRPELSLAYINEPGKGLYWVRQGASVGHLLIEEVKDGSVIVKDREKTVTLAPKRAPKKSLIKGETTSASATTLPGVSASITSTTGTSSVPVAVGAGQSTVSVEKTTAVSVVDRGELLQMRNAEQDADAVLADFIKDLKTQKAGAGSSGAEEAELQEAIAALEAMRVSTEEAQKLDRLGKELRQDQRIPARTVGSKVGKSVSPAPPPRPPQTSTRPTRTPRKLPTRRPPTIPPTKPK